MTRGLSGVVVTGGLALCLAASIASGAGPSIPPDVKQNVRDRVDKGLSVGIVVGAVDPNGTSYYCYGMYTNQHKHKVGPDTIYEIGSITKVFTSILLADCVERGTVGLDDPVAKYLPSHVKMPTRNGKQITLKHLATHRSGLPRMPTNFEPKDTANPYADYTAERLYAFLAECELEHDIGSKYLYSNLAVGLLGNALSNACGEPYEELVVQRICKPLGMNDTGITLSKDQQRRMAKGHSGRKEAKNWDITGLAGAGALRSSAKDMLRFLAANMGLVKTPLLPAMRLTHQGRHTTGASSMSVALGWHVTTKAGTEYLWHNGGTGGYHSFCGFAPAKKLGVVVLSNSTGDIDGIGRHVLDPTYPLKKPKKGITLATAILDNYVGYYELQPGVIFHITRDGKGLSAQLTGQPAVPIYPKSETQFFYTVVDAQITFVKDKNGKVTALILRQHGLDQTFRRKPPGYKPPPKKKRVEVAVDPKILERYVGKYELAPAQVFDVRTKNGKLQVKLTGQSWFPVFPESETEFFYKVVDAQLTFVVDQDGKVTQLILHQSGMDLPARKVE